MLNIIERGTVQEYSPEVQSRSTAQRYSPGVQSRGMGVARALDAKKLDGDIGQLFFKVLERLFGSTHDIRLAGVTLDGGIRIIAMVGVLLADEPALKEMMSRNGNVGNKCCCLCLNASLHNATGIPLHILCPDVAVSIACTDWNSFEKHTD